MLEGGAEKGEEWPKIVGPKKAGRVCVVGAGPAGIHMALRLKQKGYSKVNILEKTFRVGGKCKDIVHGGVPNPQGAGAAVASYFENLIPLAERYGLGEVVEMPNPNFWATNSASDPGSKLSPPAFMFGTMKEITNSSSPNFVNLGAFLQVCLFLDPILSTGCIPEAELFVKCWVIFLFRLVNITSKYIKNYLEHMWVS